MATATALGDQAPGIFQDAVASLRAWRPDRRITMSEITAPTGIAPYAYAVSAEVNRPWDPHAEGKLILLHDPQEQPAWQGTLRLVSFLSVEIDEDMYTDPALTAVAWSWLATGLERAGADHVALGGTVTCTTEARFGGLRNAGEAEDDAIDAELEIRASWTPAATDLTAHLRAWCLHLGAATGLPPEDVIGHFAGR